MHRVADVPDGNLIALTVPGMVIAPEALPHLPFGRLQGKNRIAHSVWIVTAQVRIPLEGALAQGAQMITVSVERKAIYLAVLLPIHRPTSTADTRVGIRQHRDLRSATRGSR